MENISTPDGPYGVTGFEGAPIPSTTTTRAAESMLRAQLHWLRSRILSDGLNIARLPRWVRAASVRWCWVGQTLVAVFDDAEARDTYTYEGNFHTDISFLFKQADYIPDGCLVTPFEKSTGALALIGTGGDGSRSIMNMRFSRPAFIGCGYGVRHLPVIVANMALGIQPHGADTMIALQLLPFALYIRFEDVQAPTWQTWDRIGDYLIDWLKDFHDQPIGDVLESRSVRQQAFEVTKHSSVLVLGSYDKTAQSRLEEVRNFLIGLGWDAHLLKSQADISMMSNEEKLRLWAGVSRFCVMLDEQPSGHVAEYVWLREQRVTTAVIRIGQGSTWMIGDDMIADLNYFRLFDGTQGLERAIVQASEWAAAFTQKRAERYNSLYPWRAEDGTPRMR